LTAPERFPSEAGVLRLAGSVLNEVHDQWQVSERRYLSAGSMAKIYETDNDEGSRKEVGTTSKELLAGQQTSTALIITRAALISDHSRGRRPRLPT
jgi:hypothetical protein